MIEEVDFSICPYIKDNMWFFTYYDFCDNRKVLKKMYEELKSQIDYKKSDIPKGSKSNMGYIFGKNELVRINGEKVVIQKAVDFNGTEKLVKIINRKENYDK